MKRKIIYVLPAIIVFLVFSGCEKTLNDEPEQSFTTHTKTSQSDLQKYEYSSEDQSLEQITRIVKIALNNPEFRASLKTNAMKMVDGDYDVFIDFDQNAQRGVESGLLSAANSYNEGVNDTDNMIDIISLIKSVPRLQLSVPVQCEAWDKDSYIPYVAFKPIGYNDPEPLLLKSVKGNEVKWLSTVDAPDKPVVVVGQSERFNEHGEIVFGDFSRNNQKSMDDGGSPGGGAGGGSGGGTSSRSNGDYQYLEKIKFTDINYVESWFSGKPETRLKVISSSSTVYSWYDEPNRSSVNNTWKNYHDYMFRWYTSTLGEGLVFAWHEEDPDDTWEQEWSISHEIQDGTEIGLTITLKNKDDIIGSVPVNFNDPYNDVPEYHPGSIMKFTISD